VYAYFLLFSSITANLRIFLPFSHDLLFLLMKITYAGLPVT